MKRFGPAMKDRREKRLVERGDRRREEIARQEREAEKDGNLLKPDEHSSEEQGEESER